MPSDEREILILCKTYPSPSARYAETSCVAGMDAEGKLIRLYPVPFRLISDEKQFRKWQWIRARVSKSPNDHRPESHKVFVDTIQCAGESITTKNDWRERRDLLSKVPVFDDFEAVRKARANQGTTLALLRPSRILGLDIKEADSPDWTEEERAKLMRLQQQGDLFDESDSSSIRLLRKLPFDFHYRYVCDTPSGQVEYRHKLVDWEVGALYWNSIKSTSANWQDAMRKRLETDFAKRDLMFLMGTIHRFPDQWLIISLIYPPRISDPQLALF